MAKFSPMGAQSHGKGGSLTSGFAGRYLGNHGKRARIPAEQEALMDWYDERCGEIMRVVVALRMPVREPSCRTCPMKSAPSLRIFTVIALEKPSDTHFMILETPMLLRRMVGEFAYHAKEY